MRIMRYDEIEHLQAHHPAWVLLRSPHASLVLGFLGRVFVDGNRGGQSAEVLVGLLDDELYALNTRTDGDPPFPRSAAAYLDDWASPEKVGCGSTTRPGSTSRTTTSPRRSRRPCCG